MIDEHDTDTESLPLDIPKETAVKPIRDPVTGQFVKGGGPGPGRPKGSRDRFSKQVIDSLQACWEANAEQMLAELVATKPEVVMGMVSRLLPQALVTEDISGEAGKGQSDQQVTIKVVTQQHQDVLPARSVVGELMDDSDDTHHDGARTIN